MTGRSTQSVGDAQKEFGANGVAIAADVTNYQLNVPRSAREVGVSMSLTGLRFSSASAPRRPITLYYDEPLLYKEAFD